MNTTYIPVLAIASGVMDIGFYVDAFGAVELWRIGNDDGSVHVAAFSIDGAEFRLHEESKSGYKSVGTMGGTTVTIALTVGDVHAVFARALAAGGIERMPVTDFEYGYRQGVVVDPFGHLWQIEQLLSRERFDQFLGEVGGGK